MSEFILLKLSGDNIKMKDVVLLPVDAAVVHNFIAHVNYYDKSACK